MGTRFRSQKAFRARRAMLFLSLFCAGLSGARSEQTTRAILLSWDGGADWVVDRLLEEGKLPHVARLAAAGVRAEGCRPAYPSLTACGHAALWTGAYSDVNGISGNSVPRLPRSGHTILEQEDGFAPGPLLAEPVWIPAAKAGRKVVLLSATHSQPDEAMTSRILEAGIPPGRLYTFSGFRSPITGGKVWTGKEFRPASGWEALPSGVDMGSAKDFSTTIGEQLFHFLAYDDPADPVGGLDTLLVSQGTKGGDAAARVTLKPLEAPEPAGGTQTNGMDGDPAEERFSPRFRVTQKELSGWARFRLYALLPDGRMILWQRGVSGLLGNAPAAETDAYWNAYGGFFDAPWNEYKSGELGPPLWENGDGTAERRLLEAVRLDSELVRKGTRFAWERWRPDLLIHYTPMTDYAGHTWMGLLDPDSPRYDRGIAEQLWPFYAEVFRLQDEWLGDVLNLAGSDTLVGLVSDHGMEGTGKVFYPNAVLQEAGLLKTLSNRKIRLDQTRVCAPPWADGFLCVNGTDWLGGIVPPEERETVLRTAEDALLSARDPETDARVVKAVFRPDRVQELGMGGPRGGDLYFDLAPGYEAASEVTSRTVTTERSRAGKGNHGFFPLRPKMQAICYLAGPGVPKGRMVPPVRQIDVIPTVAHLLGIPVPRDARGHMIGEMGGK